MLVLYQWKLLPYYNLSLETWMVIIVGYLSFLLGIILIFAARSLNDKEKEIFPNMASIQLKIFADGGEILKYSILIMGFIGLVSAIQHWIVLIRMFGNIPAVIINANILYRLRVDNEIKGVIPYFFIFSYVGVFLSGIYTAYKKKLTLIVLLPFLGVIIEEIAKVGRAGILLSFLEFFASFVLSRNLLKEKREVKKEKKYKMIVSIVSLIAFIIISASFIKMIRGTYESFSGESRQLKSLKRSSIISPSIYLYFSADVGVLNKYLQYENENTMFGENTFLVFYSALSKFGVVKKPSDYQTGYFIPMWTNTGTYLRELHADFGYTGIIIGPFLIGLLTTFLWFRFYETEKIIYLVWLNLFYVIIGFSFFVMATRISILIIYIFISAITAPIIETLAEKNLKKKRSRNVLLFQNN